MTTGARQTATTRSVSAGCNTCSRRWKAANAQAVAARHHDSTGHKTWVEQVLSIEYGTAQPVSEQPGLFS